MTSLGFDIGGTSLRAGLVEDGRVTAQRKVPAPRDPAAMARACAQLGDELGLPPGPVGVGMAAMIPKPRRVIERAPNFGWDDVPFADLLEDALGRPVFLLNDLEAILWGEHAAGAARGADDVLCAFLGTGFGAAAIVEGRLLLGARGVTAEIGHFKVHDSDAPCGCGGAGCVETVVGGRYLLEQAKRLDPSATDLGPLAADSAETRAIVAEAAELGARALAAAVTVLNPAVLVLGGGVLTGVPALRPALEAALFEALSPPSRVGLEVRDATLGDDAGIVGAATWGAAQLS
jgi:glucokinase